LCVKSGVESGLVNASWNKWVSDHGGDGVTIMAGVKVNFIVVSMSALIIHVRIILKNSFDNDRNCSMAFAFPTSNLIAKTA
jgi:hypothetical protein